MQPTMGPILFNANNLESLVPGLVVNALPVLLPPKKTLANQILALTNRTKTTQNYFTERKIPITCAIKQNTRVLLDQSLDVLWTLIDGVEGTLVLVEGNQQRQYTATWSDFNLKRISGGFMEFDLIFTTSDVYGYDPTYTLLCDQSGFVNSPVNITMADIGGSALYQAPIITLYLSALTAGSGTVTLGNPATGQTVSITRTWAAGDQVEIDSQNKTVKVNGILVDFTGAIPEWQPKILVGTGQSKVQYTDTFSTRTLRIRGIYYKRYA